jgi:hypothetical protein
MFEINSEYSGYSGCVITPATGTEHSGKKISGLWGHKPWSTDSKE